MRPAFLARWAKRYLQSLALAVVVSSCLLAVAGLYYGTESVKQQLTPGSAPDADDILVEMAAAKAAPSVRHLGQDHSKPCTESYGIFPCSDSLGGSIFLTCVYGAILTFAAQCIGDGGEFLLEMEVLPPSIIGGILLPILGAVPDAAIIAVSAAGSKTAAEAERKVAVGVGTLAGSTIMLLTIAYSGSVWLGRCDLVDGEAQDETLDGKKFSAATYVEKYDLCAHSGTTGITHDLSVNRIKWFMLGSSLCYLIPQIPAGMGASVTVIHEAALVGAIVCFVLLGIYLVDSSMQSETDETDGTAETPRAYAATLKSQIRQESMLQQLERVASTRPDGGSISIQAQMYDETGQVNRDAISKIFDVFDINNDGVLDEVETAKFTRVVFMSSGEKEVPEAVWSELKAARSKSQPVAAAGSCVSCAPAKSPEMTITRQAFLDVVTNLLTAPRTPVVDELAKVASEETPLVAEEEEAAGEPEGTISGALLMITFGAALATIFSDTMVNSIDSVGHITGIPNFVIGFVVCPLASNASELISSLQLASRKKKRNASVTFSQIYAACTMNNCLCLGVFMMMVWYKHLSWDYAAEVTSILVVTWVVGLCTLNDTTIPSWIAFAVIFLYPLSLALVEVLHGAGVP